MKLHEKAKQLGIKAKDLTAYLNNGGATIKSPNQELSDTESLSADRMIEMPASVTFNEGVNEELTPVIAIQIYGTDKLIIQRQYINANGVVKLTHNLHEKKFPSKPQLYAHLEYMVNLIEMGEYDG